MATPALLPLRLRAPRQPAPRPMSWLEEAARLLIREHVCSPPNEAIAWRPVRARLGPATYQCPECRGCWHPVALLASDAA